MAYGRFKSMGSLGLFQCIWQLVDHLPFAYVEKQSLSYGRKEVPFATWCFMIKANGRLSTICQTSVIVSISLSTMCHKSKICNLPYAIYHPSLSLFSAIWSRPMPLGWYFAEQWRRFEGNNWIQQKCDNWVSYDRSVLLPNMHPDG